MEPIRASTGREKIKDDGQNLLKDSLCAITSYFVLYLQGFVWVCIQDRERSLGGTIFSQQENNHTY